jgi:ketosteroid isomerase-like protein
MKAILAFVLLFPLLLLAGEEGPEGQRVKQLDAYWAEVSRAVAAGDFAGYAATCDAEGVLVSGVKKSCAPLAEALQRWKKDFDATKSGEMKASVQFKFSQRLNDGTTAHETGIFLYTATGADGKETRAYVHFEALLLKREDGWKIVMEYQKANATEAEFEALR